MKRIYLCVLLVPLLLVGCARHYVLVLNNGARVTTVGKPKLEGGAYVYKDISGETGTVFAGRVTEIAPASMVKKEKSHFKPSTSR